MRAGQGWVAASSGDAGTRSSSKAIGTDSRPSQPGAVSDPLIEGQETLLTPRSLGSRWTNIGNGCPLAGAGWAVTIRGMTTSKASTVPPSGAPSRGGHMKHSPIRALAVIGAALVSGRGCRRVRRHPEHTRRRHPWLLRLGRQRQGRRGRQALPQELHGAELEPGWTARHQRCLRLRQGHPLHRHRRPSRRAAGPVAVSLLP